MHSSSGGIIDILRSVFTAFIYELIKSVKMSIPSSFLLSVQKFLENYIKQCLINALKNTNYSSFLLY